MSELNWSTVRSRAATLFRELPHAQTEAEIIDVFELYPQVVVKAVEEVGAAVQAGKVRSGWAVLRANLRTATSDRDVSVEVGDDKQRKVKAAEAWIRNAGIHFASSAPDGGEAEVLDELYGDHADHRRSLRPWADDETLRARLVELWRKERPRGVQADRDAVERAGKWKADMQRIKAAKRLRLAELEQSATDAREAMGT